MKLSIAVLSLFHFSLFAQLQKEWPFNTNTHSKLFHQVATGTLYTKTKKLPVQVDLRDQFLAPSFQGDSKSCVVFSLLSAMESKLLQQTQNEIPLSRRYTYQLLQHSHQDAVDSLLAKQLISSTKRNFLFLADEPQTIFSSEFSEKILGKNRKIITLYYGLHIDLSLLQLHQFFSVPLDDDEYSHNKSYRIRSYTSLNFPTGPPSSHFFKSLLVSSQNFIIRLKTGTNVEKQGWINPQSSSLGHFVNLVGYGQAVNPFSSNQKPENYFLLRDSASQTGYVKISEEYFLENITSIHSILAVEELSATAHLAEVSSF